MDNNNKSSIGKHPPSESSNEHNFSFKKRKSIKNGKKLLELMRSTKVNEAWGMSELNFLDIATALNKISNGADDEDNLMLHANMPICVRKYLTTITEQEDNSGDRSSKVSQWYAMFRRAAGELLHRFLHKSSEGPRLTQCASEDMVMCIIWRFFDEEELHEIREREFRLTDEEHASVLTIFLGEDGTEVDFPFTVAIEAIAENMSIYIMLYKMREEFFSVDNDVYINNFLYRNNVPMHPETWFIPYIPVLAY